MRIKFYTLLLTAVIFLPLQVLAQNFANNPFSSDTRDPNASLHRCATDEHAHEMFNNDAAFRNNVLQSSQNWQQYVAQGQTARFADSVIRIPVVFHIFHVNGPENISLSQIQSQVRIMNEDFRKIPGTLGFGTGVDTKYEFFLAQKDPNGACTDGVVRIGNAIANNFDGHSNPTANATLKGLSQWDPTRYLNFWVVNNFTGGVLGYAQFPGGSPATDGVVVADEFVGDEGTSGTGAYGLGRTATHEVGHWLGLFHPFQGSSCANSNCSAQGDQVCDTPPTDSPTFGCPANPSKCGQRTQIENYMDYGDDNCFDKFTQGQKDRMDFFTLQSRPVLLDSMNAIDAGLYGCNTYCQSEATNTADTEISNVKLNTINNSTAGECTGYTDFITGGISTNLTRDSSYALIVTTGDCAGGPGKNHEVKAYIDWNVDGDFDDAGEDYLVKSNGPASTDTVIITVPNSAFLNEVTGMRIVATEGGVTGPCTTYAFGETEDYNLVFLAPPPVITSFNPTSGGISAPVLIIGENFNETSDVQFNGVSVGASFILLSPDSIRAFVPSGATTGPITVTTPIGSDVTVNDFTITVVQPNILSFTPQIGPIGTTVTIQGVNLGSISTVTFNGTNATFTQPFPSQIIANVPNGATTGPIQVFNAVGSGISTNDFTVTVVQPTVALSGGATVCEGDSVNLNFNLTGAGPFTLVYTDGTNNFTVNNISTTQHTETLVPAVGNYTYSIVSVTDANFNLTAPDPNLTGTAAVIVNDKPNSASLTGSVGICNGESTDITIAVNGGTAPYDVTIDNGIGFLNNQPNGTNITVSPTTTTTYNITVLRDINNCVTTNFTAGAQVSLKVTPSAEYGRAITKNWVTFTNQSVDGSTYFWEFGDGNTSTDENPVHRYDSVRQYNTCVTATSIDGCEDTHCETIIINNISGLESLRNGESLNFFPNPFSDQIKLESTFNQDVSLEITLLDASGRLLKSVTSDSNLRHNVTIESKDLPQGMYLVRILSNDGRVFSSKLFKE